MSEPTVGLRAVNTALESYEILQSAGIRSETSTQATAGAPAVAWYPAAPWSEGPGAFSGSAAVDQILLLDLESDLRRVVVSLGAVVDRHDETFGVRETARY